MQEGVFRDPYTQEMH